MRSSRSLAALVLACSLMVPGTVTAAPEDSAPAPDAMLRAQSVGALFGDSRATAAAVSMVVDAYGPVAGTGESITSEEGDYHEDADGDHGDEPSAGAANEDAAHEEAVREPGTAAPGDPSKEVEASAPPEGDQKADPKSVPSEPAAPKQFQMAPKAAPAPPGDVDSVPLGKPSQTYVAGPRYTPLPYPYYDAPSNFGIDVPAGSIACPVPGARFSDTFGAPRGRTRTHQGQDLFAPEGAPLVAMVDSVITRVDATDTWTGSMEGGDLGGITITNTAPNGDYYYNAHLLSIAPGITIGTPVRAGQVIGFVGKTGNARNTPPHVHMEWHPGGGRAENFYTMLTSSCQ